MPVPRRLLLSGLASALLVWAVLSARAVLLPRPPSRATLIVFTAASLTEAFREIGQRFEGLHPGIRMELSFAGSQQLAQQIVQGAPADVFASASPAQMEAAIASGRISAAQIFARNQLVVVLPPDNPAGVNRLQDLARPGLKLILAAPAVPVGQYALDFLDRASAQPDFGAGYRQAVLANVVSYEDNVRQVLAKVALGEADAGVVYTTDAGPDRAKVEIVPIPASLNVIARYPIAPLDDSPNSEWARAFVGFVLSAEGQELLTRHGFIAAAPATP